MPITEAARRMSERGVRRLPVVRSIEGRRQLLGIVSATDLYRAYPADRNPFAATAAEAPESKLRVQDVMTRALHTTTPETPVETAAALMRDRKIRALPVLRDAALVGLITESDIFRAFISVFEDHTSGARVTFQMSPGEDMFEFLAAGAHRRKIRILSFICARNQDQLVSVVRVSGPEIDAFIEDLWKSQHRPINVLRWG